MAKLSRKERVVIAEEALQDNDFDLAALDASLDDHFDSDAVHAEKSVVARSKLPNLAMLAVLCPVLMKTSWLRSRLSLVLT
jgi:hypothetical protein